MRILPIVLIIFSVFFNTKAQSSNTKSISNTPIVGQNEEDFGLEVDSLTEIFQDFQRTHHYGPFVDFVPEVEDSVIIKRIASVESDIPLRFDNKIKGFIDYFAVRNRDYTRKMIKRSQVYFPIIEEILAKYNMPQSLKYLAIVESGLDPTIKSWAGALGLWQFMPATGKSYSLDYDSYIDERQNPYKSTEAACKYLKMLYNMFGDWELALGAYNCGQGNMRKAIRSSGNQKTFSEVYNYLPKETRSYVPQFMAVNYVMRFAQEHNLYVEEWEGDYLPESDTVFVNQYLDLNKLCSLTGVCSEHFMELNPEIKRSTITEAWQNYPLIIPRELSLLGKDSLRSLFILAAIKDTSILEKQESETKPSSSTVTVGNNKIKHKVKSGQSLGSLASKYGVSITNIKKWNGIKGSTIYPGQIVTIYNKGTIVKTTSTSPTSNDEDETSKAVEKSFTFEENGKKYYIVRSGDILSAVAAKNDATVTQLKTWNKLTTSSIRVGQKLIVHQDENEVVTDAIEIKEPKNNLEPVKKQSYKTYYTVKSGDALGLIASKNGLTLSEIKSLNGLKSNTIHTGQKLVVKLSEKPIKEVAEGTVEKPKTIIEGINTIYVVKSGDILGSIATKNSITLEQIKDWNNLSSNNIFVGQRLVVAKNASSKAVTASEKETGVDKKVINSPSSTSETYVVKSGESLYIIATKFDMTIAALKSLNNLKSDKVAVGQKLLVSGNESKTTTKQVQSAPKIYTVQSGDTLWSITQKFNVSVDQLKKLNNLKSSELKVGQVLQIAQN